jgi:hypothetical protein
MPSPSDGSADGDKPTPRLPKVRVYDQVGQTVHLLDLTGDGLTVGRLPDNDLVLEAEGISRHHLRIDWDGSEAAVTDLGSRNGTILEDGARLTPGVKRPWSPNRPIRVGRLWLRLEAAGSAPTLGSPTATMTAASTVPGAEAGGRTGTLASLLPSVELTTPAARATAAEETTTEKAPTRRESAREPAAPRATAPMAAAPTEKTAADRPPDRHEHSHHDPDTDPDSHADENAQAGDAG